MQDMPTTTTKPRKINHGLNRSLCKGHCEEYKTGLFRSIDGVRRTYEYEIAYCATCQVYLDKVKAKDWLIRGVICGCCHNHIRFSGRNKRWREKRQNRIVVDA